MPGETLQDLRTTGRLNAALEREIYTQIHEQLQILNQNGKFHGDLNTKNILVELALDGSVLARLIDFQPEWYQASPETNSKRLWEFFSREMDAKADPAPVKGAREQSRSLKAR